MADPPVYHRHSGADQGFSCEEESLVGLEVLTVVVLRERSVKEVGSGGGDALVVDNVQGGKTTRPDEQKSHP